MKLTTALVIVSLAAAANTTAQNQSPLVGDQTVNVSDHVWAIMGFPNIGIIIGTRGTLVVDTGLGPRNGATVAKVAMGLAPNNKLYLTTTHFHPEHAAGEGGFPRGTTLIRDAVQQREMEAHGREMIEKFAARNAQQKELLANVTLRKPDYIFDSQYTLNLGGGGTPSSWVAVLDKIQPLGALHVLPDHSAIGDGSLVANEKSFIVDLKSRALDMKREGIPADTAGKTLSAEFQTKYPDWRIGDVTGFVNQVYAE